MARKLSRRALSAYIAEQLVDGNSEQDLAAHVAAYLIESHRTKELDLIIRDVQVRLAESGRVTGSVTTAFALADESRQAIEAFIKDRTNATKVEVDETVDPKVLGGVKINLPGREFDATIAHALTTLKTRYKKA